MKEAQMVRVKWKRTEACFDFGEVASLPKQGQVSVRLLSRGYGVHHAQYAKSAQEAVYA